MDCRDAANVEFHHHQGLADSAEQAGLRFGTGGVDVLVQHEGWLVNEVAQAGHKIEIFAPALAHAASHHVDYGLHRR